MRHARHGRAGLADLYGVIALVTGAAGFCQASLCCVSFVNDSELALIYVGMALGALWSGAFGMVLRGSALGRALAALGLILVLASIVLGFTALIAHEM